MMKKAIIILLLALLFCLAGCQKNEPLPDYTAQVLFSEESPAEDMAVLLWLKKPTSGMSIAGEILAPGTYTLLADHTLTTPPTRPASDYTDRVKTLLGMSDEQYRAAFNIICPNAFEYADRTLYVIRVPSYQTDRKVMVTYAGHTVIVDASAEDGTVKLSALPGIPESADGVSELEDCARIGDRFYFDHGYYDLTTQTVSAYPDGEDNPAPETPEGGYAISNLLKADPQVGKYFEEDTYYTLCGAKYLGDRLYVLLGTDARYSKTGDTLYYAVLDGTTDQVLYLEKIQLPERWCADAHFYRLGEDGLLYEPYVADGATQ